MKKIISLFSLFVFMQATLVSAQSWSNPTVAPTGGNAYTPINVGTSAQVKDGSLSVNAFIASQNASFSQKVNVMGSSDYSYAVNVNGSVGAGAYFYTSDKTLKTNITPISGALGLVNKLQGVRFTWKKDGKESIGLIAQDVEKVFPQLVSTGDNGIKSIEYGNLIAPLIEAVKEQQIQIETLKAEVAALKSNK